MQVLQGFATMLSLPTSAVVGIAFANHSQQAQTRRLLAAPPSEAAAAASGADMAVTVTIQPPVPSNVTSSTFNSSALAVGHLTAPTVARLLSSAEPVQSQSALGFAVTKVTQSYRTGACGNGICEVGERGIKGTGNQSALLKGSCPDDCPVEYMACASFQSSRTCSGRGSCLSSQGICSCFPG